LRMAATPDCPLDEFVVSFFTIDSQNTMPTSWGAQIRS